MLMFGTVINGTVVEDVNVWYSKLIFHSDLPSKEYIHLENMCKSRVILHFKNCKITILFTVRRQILFNSALKKLKGSVSSSMRCTFRLLVVLCLSPFSWAMIMAITKANQETTHARNDG